MKVNTATLDVFLYSIFVGLLAVTDTISVTGADRPPLVHFVVAFLVALPIVWLSHLTSLRDPEFISRTYLFSCIVIFLILSDVVELTGWSMAVSQILFILIGIAFLLFIIINIIGEKRSWRNFWKYLLWAVFPLIYWAAYLFIRTVAEFGGNW